MKAEKLSAFKDFFSRIKKSDKIAIVYHRDADGFCSALIAAKAIERMRGKRPGLLLHQNYEILDAKPGFFKTLRAKRISKAILLDLSVDQKPMVVKKLEKFSDVLVIDHHKFYNDLSSAKTVFVKAQFLSNIDPSRYPASKMCFDLFSGIVDVSDLDWVACVGILGDFGHLAWQQFFEEVIARNTSSLRDMRKLKELIDAVSILERQNLASLFDEFFEAKNPSDLLDSKHWATLEKLNAEVGNWFDSIRQRAEFFPEIGLVWLEIKSKSSIKSPLINKLSSELFPNQTVIVIADAGKSNLTFSARRQDFKVKMNELLENAVANIKGANAGGHIPAAAGKVPRKYLNKFKQNIIALLQRQRVNQ